MVKVERCSNAPASLGREAKKNWGSNRESDVIGQLCSDFNGKCYICEIKPVQDPEVEHRLLHYNRSIPERVFDWNNLFYACRHCNNVKNSPRYDEGIIDCCVRDPEDLLDMKLSESLVCVKARHGSDLEAVRTAELIEEVFNSTSTGIRTIAGQIRLRELQVTMNALISQMDKYRRDPGNQRILNTLQALTKRSSKFSGFTRAYCRGQGFEFLFA